MKCAKSARGMLSTLEMDNSSPEEVIFTIGEKFSAFSELTDKIADFQKANFVQLYIRRSRSIEAAAKRAARKQFNSKLKYSEIEYSCIHGGITFRSTSTGERPNQK